VSSNIRGLRGLLIAIVVIVLGAGAVAAAGPSGHAANGLATAAEKAGKTVPVAAQEQEDPDEDAGEDVEEDAPETTDATDAAGDHCATDPRTLDDEALAALNHGAIVCWAAHQETPEGYDNHGAWVSSWAKDNHGHAEDANGAAADAPAAATTGRGHAKTGHGHAGD
jgi:hypothetical protein